MPLTQAEKQGLIAAITAALNASVETEPGVPWYKDNTGPAPTTPLPNADDEEADKHYAAYGLKYDLTRGVAPSDDAAMIAICDQIAAATTPQQAEAAIKNAGYYPPDVAIYFVRTGCTQGFSAFMQPMIMANPVIQTIRDAALYAVGKWNGTGPGPGIG
jgi:hypothetical protein